MASIFAYFRPRGVQGNYKVGILLDLLRTEHAKVKLFIGERFKENLEYQLESASSETRKIYFTKTALSPGASFEIEIKDADVAMPQCLLFAMTKEVIKQDQKTVGYNAVIFHEITLVDLDELTQAARQGKIHELEYMPEIAEVRQLLQQD